jgi:hypothetical protein
MPLGLEIPTGLVFSSKNFRLSHKQQITGQGGGFLQTIDRATPMWLADYATPPLRGDRYNAAIEFLMRLEGSIETFLAFDPRRPMPYNYRTATVGSNPLGTVTTTSYNASTGALGLASGSVNTAPGFVAGDYLSMKIGNIWYLFRVAIGANLSGQQATVIVRPRLPITIPNGTVVRYQKACAEMKMIGGFKEDDAVESLPTISFRAAQFINRAT